MIEMKPLKEESFTYQGKRYSNEFPIAYYLAVEKDRVCGFLNVDLLENSILSSHAKEKAIEEALKDVALYYFEKMSVSFVIDKRTALAQRIELKGD